MAGKKGRQGPPRGAVALVLGALLLVAALAVIVRPASAHPQPRSGITGAEVVDAARYAELPRVRETYRMAKEVAAVLDGLHCYCECDQHSGHYSLLDCFRSDHGAACDICLTEAQIAWQMTQEGKSLDEIRARIDQLYGG